MSANAACRVLDLAFIRSAPDQQPAHHHGRAGCDRRPGVGDDRGVLRRNLEHPAPRPRLADELRKIVFVPWPISVDAVRIRISSVGGELERGHAGEVDLARAGEARPMPRQRKADAPGRAGVFAALLARAV